MEDKIIPFAKVSGASKDDREEEFKQYLKSHTFDPANKPREDDSILFLQYIPIGSRENIITITGRSKSRKTVAASALASSMFMGGDSFLGFSSSLPEDAHILHFDTEQGYQHYYRSVDRIFRDANVSFDPRFTSVHSRDADVQFRRDLLVYLVELLHPSVIIVDGIIDLMYDENDKPEAVKLVEFFRRLTAKDRSLLVAVIHTTKTTGFMAGAVGTAFERSAETVIKVELMEDNPMISNISCQFSRNKPFQTFSIEADEHHRYKIVDESKIIKNGRKSFENLTKEEHLSLLSVIFGKNSSISTENFEKHLREKSSQVIGDVITRPLAKKWLKQYAAEAYIIQGPDSFWIRPLSSIQPSAIPIFDQEKDDLPF